MSEGVMSEPCPCFWETKDKVRKNDIGATDPWRT